MTWRKVKVNERRKWYLHYDILCDYGIIQRLIALTPQNKRHYVHYRNQVEN